MYLIWIGLLLLIASVLFRNNKYLYVVQIVFLWLVAANNTWNADYTNYINGYRFMFNYHGLISEPIYWLLARISYFAGLDFQGFRYLFFGIAYIVLGIGIWKLAEFPNIIMGLYFLYPFSVDVIQMRGLMANAFAIIMVWEIREFVNKGKRRGLSLSILFIVLAAGFHYSAIAFAIVYLAILSKQTFRKHFPKFVGLGIIAIAIMVIFSSRINGKLIELGILEKAISYQSYDYKIGGYLISVFALRCIFILICWLAIYSPKKENAVNGCEMLLSNQFLFRCTILLSLYAFLELFVSMEIERISRVALILGYILLTDTAVISRKNNYWAIKVLMMMFVVVYFYIMYFRHFSASTNWFNYAFTPIFENNLLN